VVVLFHLRLRNGTMGKKTENDRGKRVKSGPESWTARDLTRLNVTQAWTFAT
jgi:hypothetical protein